MKRMRPRQFSRWIAAGFSPSIARIMATERLHRCVHGLKRSSMQQGSICGAGLFGSSPSRATRFTSSRRSRFGSGILYEVNNTFGETHVYAAATPDSKRNKHETDKAFHVSPFFDVSGAYEFTLKRTDDALSLIIATKKQGQQTHVATISAQVQPATTGAFVKLALTKPISSLTVSLAIHWQALKLWLKGAKYHSKPKQSSVRTTIATSRSAAAKTAPVSETTA